MELWLEELMKRPLYKRRAVHCCPVPHLVDMRFVYKIDRRDVIVLAVVGMNAMVRRPRCAAYVADAKDLERA